MNLEGTFHGMDGKHRACQAAMGENNARGNQENLIEQLKNGVRAMRMPVAEFDANLGLHGHRLVGLEPQGMGRALATQPARRSHDPADGVSPLPQQGDPATHPDPA